MLERLGGRELPNSCAGPWLVVSLIILPVRLVNSLCIFPMTKVYTEDHRFSLIGILRHKTHERKRGC